METKQGFRLRLLRLLRLGLPQKLFADRLNVSQATMSRWVAELADPRADHLDALQHLLDELHAEITMDYSHLSTEQLQEITTQAEGFQARRRGKRRPTDKKARKSSLRKTS